MKTMQLIVLVSLLALSLTACHTKEAQSTAGAVLFSDNFSTTAENWGIGSDADSTIDYYNDAFRISITRSNYQAWSLPPEESYTDVRIEVDATKTGGPDDNDFGIFCRYIDENQYYYALISSDGYYGIVKQNSSGSFILGDEDALLESSAIKQGEATNHIRFDCIGNKLMLFVNGSFVAEETDSSYTTGNVGLSASTYDTAGTEILFDNFFIYQP